MEKLTLKEVRKAVKQLHAKSMHPPKNFSLPMRDDIRLTVNGVVWIPGFAFMHPKSFIDIAGKKAYKHLLTLPRIVTSYDTEDGCS